jgi:saccharopine dehydrogenase (NADP+, L-glutamate forming)
MVILDHHLDVEYPGSERVPERIRSTLVAYGDRAGEIGADGRPAGFTAMARTVGAPVAIAVKQLLTGELKLTGSHIPTDPSIYGPELAELANEGLEFTETVRPREPAR